MHRRILDDDRKLAILTTTLSCDCRNETIFSPSRSLVGLPRVHFRSDLGADVRFGSRSCENVFPPPKTAGNGRDPRRRDRLSIFLVYRVWSQSGRNLELILSDLNGHTARTTAHAPQARI